MKLTSKSVAALRLPSGKLDVIHFDDALPGFGFRLRRGSDKVLRSFVAQFRAGGGTRRVTLGAAEVLTADQARTEARKILARSGFNAVLYDFGRPHSNALRLNGDALGEAVIPWRQQLVLIIRAVTTSIHDAIRCYDDPRRRNAVGHCVVFLASDESSFITGSTLSANGGQVMM